MFQEIECKARLIEEDEKRKKKLYLIHWTIGEKFPAQKSLNTFNLPRQEKHFEEAFYEGRLLFVASIENGSGVITLMETETEYEIYKFIQNNPEVLDKRMQAKIKPCKLLHWKNST